MPTFTNVDVETKIDIDFEVYCNTCGAGLCNESDATRGNSRGYLQVRVNACPDCIKEKEDEIDELKRDIELLEKRIEDLTT